MEDPKDGAPPPAGETPERRAAASTTRSQSVVHYIERSHDDAARLLLGLLDRTSEPDAGLRLMLIAPSADDALALNASLVAMGRTPLVPLTSAGRGRRQLATAPSAIAGSPGDLAALRSESVLPLEHLQAVVLLWPEEMLPDERLGALESILAEAPRTAERLAVASARSPALDAFLERAMWRARPVDHLPEAGSGFSATVRLVVASRAEQTGALRAVLDAFDPARTVLVTSTDEGERAAREAMAVLGGGHGGLLDVSRGTPATPCDLAVLFDDLVAPETVADTAQVCADVVAITRPSRVAQLRRLGASVIPLVWSGAAAAARSAQDQLRDEIRGTIASGAHIPWVAAIEPMLGDVDAVEVAAATVALLDRERRRSRRAQAAQSAAPAQDRAPAAAAPSRGEYKPRAGGTGPRDRGDRPGTARGSRFEREPRGRGGKFGGERRERGARPERDARDRGSRPARDARDRGPRFEGASRGRESGRDQRPPRGAGFRRDEGGPPRRRDDIERTPRAANEHNEWSSRGDRLRHSKRRPQGSRDDE